MCWEELLSLLQWTGQAIRQVVHVEGECRPFVHRTLRGEPEAGIDVTPTVFKPTHMNFSARGRLAEICQPSKDRH
jgi:hypothetical protein